MEPASHSFEELLDFTLKRMEAMKKEGVRWVSVNPDWLSPLEPANYHSPVQEREKSDSTSPSAPPTPRSREVPPLSGLQKPALKTGERKIDSSGPETANPTSSRNQLAAPKAKTKPLDLQKLSDQELNAGMDRLRAEALQCQKCPHLAESRRNVVFGVGNINADLMFVGEAPGMDEDLQGEPFVGKAGQLLTKIIEAMGLSREEVYIGNALKCRPDTPGQAYGNRKPTPDEIANCLPFIEKQVELIRPKALVALGASAVEALYGEKVYITRIRGQRRDYRGIPLMPTFHPSYLLRNSSHAVKRLVWEDMLEVMEILGMPISEKQQGYFKK